MHVARRSKPDGLEKLGRDELYELYWTSNKSLRQIARLYETSDTTIIRWMKRYGIARRDKSAAAKLWLSFHDARMKLRKKFVARPSETLGYILGVLLGDGFLCKHDPSKIYQVGLDVKNKVFAKEFYKALTKIGLNPFIFADSRGIYRVRANSINFYEWYKSLDLNQVASLIQGHERSFVRALYESEGYVGMHKESGRLYIQISNTRRELLALTQDILFKWNIKSRVYSLNKNEYFRLTIWGDERVKKFLRIIKPCIKTSSRIEPVSTRLKISLR